MDGKKLAKSFREGVPSKDVGALSMRPPHPASTKNNASHGGSYDKTNQESEREIRSTDTKWPGVPKREYWDVDAPYHNDPSRPRSPSKRVRGDDGKSRAAARTTEAEIEMAAAFRQLGRQRRKEKEDAERRRREEDAVGKPVVLKDEPKRETDSPADTQLDMIDFVAQLNLPNFVTPTKAPVLALKSPPEAPPCETLSLVVHTDKDEGWEHLASTSSDSEDDTDTVGGWEML